MHANSLSHSLLFSCPLLLPTFSGPLLLFEPYVLDILITNKALVFQNRVMEFPFLVVRDWIHVSRRATTWLVTDLSISPLYCNDTVSLLGSCLFFPSFAPCLALKRCSSTYRTVASNRTQLCGANPTSTASTYSVPTASFLAPCGHPTS